MQRWRRGRMRGISGLSEGDSWEGLTGGEWGCGREGAEGKLR